MRDPMVIGDKDLFLLLKEKYPYAVDELGEEKNKETSIFKDWIELFTSLCELEKFCQAERQIDESDFKGDSYHSERMRELFLSLWLNDERIFSYKHEIHFELFQIYQRSLESYDQRVVGRERNQFFRALRNYKEFGTTSFPIQACLLFCSIFTEQLRLKDVGLNYSYSIQNQQLLFEAQKEVFELFKRYGHLYTLNVMYQLKLPRDLTSKDDICRFFQELRAIEEKIVSDGRLVKVFFKLEDDGLHGCLLNCILIYPIQALSNINQCLTQLQGISKASASDIQINFENFGSVLKQISETEVVGRIDNTKKLENFCYWAMGAFYRHDEFFCYHYPLEHYEKFIHEQVSTPWTLGLQVSAKGIQGKDMSRIYSELMSSISDVDEVWSTNILSQDIQKRLIIDKTMLCELPYELNYEHTCKSGILYCLQVFYTFLELDHEPFFHIEKFKGIVIGIKPSRLGRQLIYLYNLLLQQPELINEIQELDQRLDQRFSKLLNSQLWKIIRENLVQRGSTAIEDIGVLYGLDQLRGHYRVNPIGARISGFNEEDIVPYTPDDFVTFERRTADAYKYFDGLLLGNQLICRFKFYADVEGESFLNKREVFSQHFTEFLRIHKRSRLLKDLNGYFLIWLDEPCRKGFQDRKSPTPYVDVIFVMQFVYGFSYQSFEKDVLNAWRKYQGKKSLIGEEPNPFRTRGFESDVLMNSEESLRSTFVVFEKKNKKLKKVLLEKLLPYFTYRHFYLPKLHDQQDKKVKLFSKGTVSKKSRLK